MATFAVGKGRVFFLIGSVHVIDTALYEILEERLEIPVSRNRFY